jgi:monoamine oxidase
VAEDADVVVLGAGAAGLAAASRLSAAGLRVLLLEARRRVGGRILTLRAAGCPLPVELGAEFVHGTAPESWNLIRHAGLSVLQAGEHHLEAAGGRVREAPGFRGTLESLVELAEREPDDQSVAELLPRLGPADQDRAELVRRYVEGFHAAELDRASAKAVARSERGSGAGGCPAFRILDGYDALPDALRGRLGVGAELRLDARVTLVRWSRGRVEVTARSSLRGAEPLGIIARAAVVTLPLGVLKGDGAATPRFDPEPRGKRAALERLEMGPALRLVLRFREVWWDDAVRALGDEPLAFVHLPEAPIPTWWAPAPVRTATLTGWAGGPAAARFAGRGTHALVNAGLDALAGAFGASRGRLDELLVAAYSHDWSADPFACGAYSYVLAGGLPAQAELARPVEDTLFYAGEATHTEGEHASVHGAIATGDRAAAELLAALGR